MNPLQYVFTEIQAEIPPAILQLCFTMAERKQPGFDPSRLSLYELIMSKVIRPRVLLGCNLVAGKQKEILLQYGYWEQGVWGVAESMMGIGQFAIYRIPPEEREGMSIASVISITYPSMQYSNLTGVPGYGMGTTVGMAANAVLASHTFSNTPMMPLPEILAGDLVRLNPPQHSHFEYVMKCLLCYDDQFTNMNSDAIPPFAELVLEAVKAYIYTNTIVELDQGHVQFGMEIGTIKTIIDGYAESNKRYKELLDDFSGSALFDTKRKIDLFRYML